MFKKNFHIFFIRIYRHKKIKYDKKIPKFHKNPSKNVSQLIAILKK